MAIDSDELFVHFPFLKDGATELLRTVRENLLLRPFEPGTVLTKEEESCAYLPVVHTGEIRVFQWSESGRELTLYRINEGESCILTTFSILNQTPFPARAITTESSRLYLLPAPLLHQWMDRYEPWRRYIFQLLSRRLHTTLVTLSELAFKRVDIRLMEMLLHRTMGKRVEITHQELANELGTAREVVSRILKELEREGLITLSRGVILIPNKEELHRHLLSRSP